MKVRIIIAAAIAIMLAVAASSASGGTVGLKAGKSITVWLQTDASSSPAWLALTAATNAQFQKDHPGVDVNVQYQTWGSHLQKFDATLAGGNTPDVIEMGNTEMTKYMAAGAFQDLTAEKASFPNSSTWLKGLAASGVYNGKTYGVPYYAGSRLVTYRTDQYKAAGASSSPTSLAQLTSDLSKLNKKYGSKKGWSPLYIAGTDWYFALSFVYDFGGSIAQQISGKWKGTLESPRAVAGLTAYKAFFNVASRASKTTDETHPNPYDVYAQGLAGSIAGPGWFTCCVGKTYTPVTAQFVMPSHTKGLVMPGFLGGSDLAVPIGGDKALGEDWIRDYTSTAAGKAQQAMGNIPNTTSLFNPSNVHEKAASRSWFVPTSKNWVNVENGNVLRTMLAQILTGKLTVKQAAQTADANITFTLNQ